MPLRVETAPSDIADRLLDLVDQSDAQAGDPVLVVQGGGIEVGLRLGMQRVVDHFRRSSKRARARASAWSPSTSLAVPSSTSRARRSISAAHLRAASESGSPSRLRIRSRASSARSRSEGPGPAHAVAAASTSARSVPATPADPAALPAAAQADGEMATEIEPRNRGSHIAATKPARVARRWSQSLADYPAQPPLSSRHSNGNVTSVSFKSRWVATQSDPGGRGTYPFGSVPRRRLR